MISDEQLQNIKPEYRNRLSNSEIERQLDNVRSKLTQWADKIVVGGFYSQEDLEKKNEEKKKELDRNESLSKIYQEARTPWWCPKCKNILDTKIHEKFYRIRGTCHRCVLAYEHLIRVEGLWPAYERKLMRENERSWLRDQINGHLDYIKTFKVPQAHYQDGRWEELAKKEDFYGMFEKLLEDVEFMEKRIEQINKEEKDDEPEQQRLAEWRRNNPWKSTAEN